MNPTDQNLSRRSPDLLALLGYFTEHKRDIGLSTTLAVLQAFPALGMALYVRTLFDEVIPAANTSYLIFICLAILGLGILRSAMALLAAHINLRVSKQVIAELRMALTAKLYQLSQANINYRSLSKLHSVIVQDTQRLDMMVNAAITVLLPSLVSSVVLFLLLIIIQWQLALCLLLFIPLALVLARHTNVPVQASIAQDHDAYTDFSQRTWFILHALRLTHSRGATSQETSRQSKFVRLLELRSRKMAWLLFAYHKHLPNILALTAVCVTLGIGGALVLHQHLTIGQFLAFCAALALLRQQIGNLSTATPNVIAGSQALAAVQTLLAEPEHQPYTGDKAINFTGAISVNNIDFSYDSHSVLHTCTLRLNAGESVALSGNNGAGKTTLIDLIIGHIAPDNGEILADGIPYHELDIGRLQQSMGVVPQNPLIFPGTVYENIAYGVTSTTKEEVYRAAQSAGAYTFIDKLPQKFQTLLEDKGTQLSGGQRQCIAIARALLHEPRLLILDEPGNHLDPSTLKHILNSLNSLPQNPALLLVTHNLNIVTQLDRHYRLENGVLTDVTASK